MDPILKQRYADAARDALLVQNGCNLSGIVFGFAEHMKTLCDVCTVLGEGTDWRNRHPIARLFISKLSDMAGSDYEIDQAKCREIVEKFGDCTGGFSDSHTRHG